MTDGHNPPLLQMANNLPLLTFAPMRTSLMLT